jgi:hypothetical protein
MLMIGDVRRMAIVLLVALSLAGCSYFKEGFKGGGKSAEKEPPKPKSNIESLAVVGFLPTKEPGDDAGMVRNHLSGSMQMCRPVSREIVEKMTSSLMNGISTDHGYRLVPPEQVWSMFRQNLSSKLILGDVDLLKSIGQQFSTDAVLVGYIYQWRELRGTDYAAKSPASVAFDLYMVETRVGAILWKGNYDKTQRSLSENILDRMTFLRAGGKWLSAEQLAQLGLEDLLAKLPKAKKPGAEQPKAQKPREE